MIQELGKNKPNSRQSSSCRNQESIVLDRSDIGGFSSLIPSARITLDQEETSLKKSADRGFAAHLRSRSSNPSLKLTKIPTKDLGQRSSFYPKTSVKRFKSIHLEAVESYKKEETCFFQNGQSTAAKDLSDEFSLEMTPCPGKASKELKQTRKVHLDLSPKKACHSKNSSTLATVEVLPKTIQIRISNEDGCKRSKFPQNSVEKQLKRHKTYKKTPVSQKFEEKIERLALEHQESLRSKRSTQCSDSAYPYKSGYYKHVRIGCNKYHSKCGNEIDEYGFGRKSEPVKMKPSIAPLRPYFLKGHAKIQKSIKYQQRMRKMLAKKGSTLKAIRSMKSCNSSTGSMPQRSHANSLHKYTNSGTIRSNFSSTLPCKPC
ncbi:unnamed protein product [Moneuplotes crassus]|uniref:Uncharacterized protein n=1 Tax=Euplotes crassus TaxID=5936 RepID=A0AAD1XAF3_EUPCR|nr:unnamed protein product [Moneuplotes crassus]